MIVYNINDNGKDDGNNIVIMIMRYGRVLIV